MYPMCIWGFVWVHEAGGVKLETAELGRAICRCCSQDHVGSLRLTTGAFHRFSSATEIVRRG